jgi:guanylate kinase
MKPPPAAPPALARRGLLFVLSSPSGAGKTTLSRALLAAEPGMSMSVSVTTRPPRTDEVEGRDYYFRDRAAFERMAEAGDLLESAHVFANRYGTPRAPVEAALRAGRDVLFDIDWQGARQLATQMPDDLVRVFILPPSAAVLEQRLRGRGQDPDEVVAQRMAAAAEELSHWYEYDYVVVNDVVEAAVDRLRAILAGERHRRARHVGMSDFVHDMISALR